jgi:hypothetical protein
VFLLSSELAAISGDQQRRTIWRTTGASGNVNRGASRDVKASPSRDVKGSGNRDINRDVNRNPKRDIDVDVDRNWGYGCCYHPVARAATAAAVTTAAAVGSTVYELPSSCEEVTANGVTYEQCGSTWYQPEFSGSSVEYTVVNSPK